MSECGSEDAQLQEEEETLTLDFYLPSILLTASKDLNEETVVFYYSFYSSVIFIQFLFVLCVAVFSARCHIIALICTVSNNASSSMGVCWWSKLTVVQSLLSHLYTKNTQ